MFMLVMMMTLYKNIYKETFTVTLRRRRSNVVVSGASVQSLLVAKESGVLVVE